jgi:hypothetical protein
MMLDTPLNVSLIYPTDSGHYPLNDVTWEYPEVPQTQLASNKLTHDLRP